MKGNILGRLLRNTSFCHFNTNYILPTHMKKQLMSVAVAASLLTACGGAQKTTAEAEKFDYTVEQFADLQILRYRVPEFENLSLKQKELVYYLTEAALQGRDILFDQNGKYNLRIRRMLEAVYTGYDALPIYSPPLRLRKVCSGLHSRVLQESPFERGCLQTSACRGTNGGTAL